MLHILVKLNNFIIFKEAGRWKRIEENSVNIPSRMDHSEIWLKRKWRCLWSFSYYLDLLYQQRAKVRIKNLTYSILLKIKYIIYYSSIQIFRIYFFLMIEFVSDFKLNTEESKNSKIGIEHYVIIISQPIMKFFRYLSNFKFKLIQNENKINWYCIWSIEIINLTFHIQLIQNIKKISFINIKYLVKVINLNKLQQQVTFEVEFVNIY